MKTILSMLICFCCMYANAQNAGTTTTRESYLNNLFKTKDGAVVLKPELFKEATRKSDLKGQKVSITKDGKSYAFLGNQDELIKVISKPTSRAQECTDCTTRTCNGVTYDCTCVNGFCMCVICVEITTLSPEAEKVVSPKTKDIKSGTRN